MGKSSKPRKKYVPRQQHTGPITLASIGNILRPLEKFLSDLRNEEVITQNDEPMLYDWQDFLCPAIPAIQGWVECFERIARGERIFADWSGLRQLAIALRDDAELTSKMIDKAEKEVGVCRHIMRTLTREKLGSYMRTEMIAIEQEDIGIATKRTLELVE